MGLVYDFSSDGGDLLGSVDSYGRAMVGELPDIVNNNSNHKDDNKSGFREGRALYQLTPPVLEGEQRSPVRVIAVACCSQYDSLYR